MIWVIGVLGFLFVPIATIVLFAFDRSNIQSWPIHHYTTRWFSVAWHDEEVRTALGTHHEATLVGLAPDEVVTLP